MKAGRPGWFPDWSGEVCAIVASGPSVKVGQVEKLRGRCRVIVINNNYQIAPWADVLYACDAKWWNWHKGVPEFTGMKITQDVCAAALYGLNLVRLLESDDPQANCIVVDRPGVIGRGGNSGFQAVNLAVQFGARKYLLVGFDCYGERWHGAHPNGRPSQKSSTLDEWRKNFDAQAVLFAKLGVEVANVSDISALTAYQKMSIEAALHHFGIMNAAG